MGSRTEYEKASDQGYRLWLIQCQDMDIDSSPGNFDTGLAAAIGGLICCAVKDYAITADEACEMGRAYFDDTAKSEA